MGAEIKLCWGCCAPMDMGLRPFERVVEMGTLKRSEAKIRDGKVSLTELMYKVMMNSIYGKSAQGPGNNGSCFAECYDAGANANKVNRCT